MCFVCHFHYTFVLSVQSGFKKKKRTCATLQLSVYLSVCLFVCLPYRPCRSCSGVLFICVPSTFTPILCYPPHSLSYRPCRSCSGVLFICVPSTFTPILCYPPHSLSYRPCRSCSGVLFICVPSTFTPHIVLSST